MIYQGISGYEIEMTELRTIEQLQKIKVGL